MNARDIVRQLLLNERVKQDELAEELGVTQATVSRWLSGSQPRGETYNKIMEMGRQRGLIEPLQPKASRSANASRFSLIPVITWISAGSLADSKTDIPIQDAPKIAVADLGSGEFFALRVEGTSMDRISPDKSLIIVNRAQKALQDGKPYVFAVRGEVTYKLWRPSPPRLQPYSTDPANEPIFLDKQQNMYVIGRVRRSILDL